MQSDDASIDGFCKQGRSEQHTKPTLHIPCETRFIL